MTRTVLYARVSTTDQTIEHQQAQAEAAGFVLDEVIEDHGVSGVQTSLAERDNGKRLFDMLRDGDILVVRWVDRLGRNYDDIQKNIRLFLDRGVTIKTVINMMTFDAQPQDAMSKAIRDAMLSFMSAMAEAQAIGMKEAQTAGIAHAKANDNGPKPTKYRGRKPSYNWQQWYDVLAFREVGFGVNEVARRVGLNKFLVSRISNNQVKTFEALGMWNMLPPVIDNEHRSHTFERIASISTHLARAEASMFNANPDNKKNIQPTGFEPCFPEIGEWRMNETTNTLSKSARGMRYHSYDEDFDYKTPSIIERELPPQTKEYLLKLTEEHKKAERLERKKSREEYEKARKGVLPQS